MDEDGLEYIVRFSKNDDNAVRGVFAGTELKSALASLQYYTLGLPVERRWNAIEYLVDYGQLNVILSYDEIDRYVPIWKRTPSLIEKHFPGKKFEAS